MTFLLRNIKSRKLATRIVKLTVDGTGSVSSGIGCDSLYCSRPERNRASISSVFSLSGNT